MKKGGLSDSEDEGDEEFGEFAMPEGEGEAKGAGGRSGSGEGQGAGEGSPLKVVKPLAVHPVAGKSGFGSLWPFNTQHFGARETRGEEGEKSDKGKEEEKGAEGSKQEEKDGEGISRTVEAKKRTSLDDGDDEVVV